MVSARVGYRLHGDYVVNMGWSLLDLGTHPVVIYPLAGGVLREFKRKLMKLYPPAHAKIVNQKQYRIKGGGMVKIYVPLRISKRLVALILSPFNSPVGTDPGEWLRLPNLESSSSDHWFVKCILFYFVQERRWEKFTFTWNRQILHQSLRQCYINPHAFCHHIDSLHQRHHADEAGK